MKITIELPDAFKEHFELDKFQKSFTRILLLAWSSNGLCGKYERDFIVALKTAFETAKANYNGDKLKTNYKRETNNV